MTMIHIILLLVAGCSTSCRSCSSDLVRGMWYSFVGIMQRSVYVIQYIIMRGTYWQYEANQDTGICIIHVSMCYMRNVYFYATT